jgi:hypothetical protein
LVDYFYYMEGLATFIGCEVPLAKVFMRDPHLWWKLVFAPLSGAHYRLVGPGSNWKEASTVIKQTPTFRNRQSALWRWTVLSMLTIFSLMFSLNKGEYKSVARQASE